jgi:hypothetical protein
MTSRSTALAGLMMTAAAVVFVSPARADLVSCATCIVDLGAQGFGNAPRLLTIQTNQNNQTGIESGVVIPSATGTVTIGPGIPDPPNVFHGNGITNTGGNEVTPLTGDKFSVPTLGSLGYTDATKINILFNATEPGGDGLSITDVTLKFYTSGGGFVGAIDGSQTFSSTFTGNGNAGFLFTVSADEVAAVNGFIAAAGQTGRIALESTITGAAGGPESFTAFNPSMTPPVPEMSSWGMMILGFAGVGLLAYRRRERALRLA